VVDRALSGPAAPIVAPSADPADGRTPAVRIAEAVAVAGGGSLVAALAGSLLHPVVGVVLGTVALLNGAICGWRAAAARPLATLRHRLRRAHRHDDCATLDP
jgi:hypothetical protein